jgi:hypothetical protein
LAPFSQNTTPSRFGGGARAQKFCVLRAPSSFCSKSFKHFLFLFLSYKISQLGTAPHGHTTLFSLLSFSSFFFLLFSPEHRDMKREFERGWDWEIEIDREESLREGKTKKERSRVREFERESWELGETLPVGAERRSGKPVTQIPDFLQISRKSSSILQPTTTDSLSLISSGFSLVAWHNRLEFCKISSLISSSLFPCFLHILLHDSWDVLPLMIQYIVHSCNWRM